MIRGVVSEERVPRVELVIAGQRVWAVVDTGFNGDLELPDSLQDKLDCIFLARRRSLLAAGMVVEEDVYRVLLEFDGRQVEAEVTFAPGQEALIGTGLLADYRLEVDFVRRTVELRKE